MSTRLRRSCRAAEHWALDTSDRPAARLCGGRRSTDTTPQACFDRPNHSCWGPTALANACCMSAACQLHVSCLMAAAGGECGRQAAELMGTAGCTVTHRMQVSSILRSLVRVVPPLTACHCHRLAEWHGTQRRPVASHRCCPLDSIPKVECTCFAISAHPLASGSQGSVQPSFSFSLEVAGR